MNNQITISKEHVGKTVYGKPTRNNARFNSTVTVFEVVKVGRRYAELKREGWDRTVKYDVETGASEDSIRSGHGGNAGYRWFDSMESYQDYVIHQEKLKKILDYFRGYSQPDLNSEQVNEIYLLIFGDDQ